MVAANGGPDKCLGEPSATGLGVHLTFLSEESPKPTTSPRTRPRPTPSTSPREEEDVKMVDSSGSSSGSDTDTAEHTPQSQHVRPSSTLKAPRVPRRAGDRRLENWIGRNFAPADGSVPDSTAPVAQRRPAPYSDLKDVEEARRRVHQQRLKEAKRIQLEQLLKGAQREARQLRQRADDLEHETSEHMERLLRGEEEVDEEEVKAAKPTAMEEDGADEDQSDVQSNWSYTPTEVYSRDGGDQPRRSSPSPSLLRPVSPTISTHSRNERSQTPTPTRPSTPVTPQVTGPSSLRLEPYVQRARGPLHRQHTMVLTPPLADEFVVVTRQVVDGLDDVAGSHVRRTKHYLVRQADLESLHGKSDMEE